MEDEALLSLTFFTLHSCSKTRCSSLLDLPRIFSSPLLFLKDFTESGIRIWKSIVSKRECIETHPVSTRPYTIWQTLINCASIIFVIIRHYKLNFYYFPKNSTASLISLLSRFVAQNYHLLIIQLIFFFWQIWVAKWNFRLLIVTFMRPGSPRKRPRTLSTGRHNWLDYPRWRPRAECWLFEFLKLPDSELCTLKVSRCK